MDRECLKVAARMLNPDNPDVGLIHALLRDEINAVDDMVHRAGGELISRQVIANIIHQWRHACPTMKPYGD